jgi:FkbM family methyltransferase
MAFMLSLSTVARSGALLTRPVGYRGIGRIFRHLRRIKRFRDAVATVKVSPSRTVTFPAFDPYWAAYLWTPRVYEPDVQAVFETLAGVEGKAFIDCGANIGYWSSKLSDPIYGYKKLIAIEANAVLMRFLETNFRNNGIPGEAIHAAISERSGETAFLASGEGELHASGHLAAEGVPVQTINLADVLARLDPAETPVAVVKLDVEGAELAALKGAGNPPVELIYVIEEWVGSPDSPVPYLLDQGYALVGVDLAGKYHRLRSSEALERFTAEKLNGQRPMNVVACLAPEKFFALEAEEAR